MISGMTTKIAVSLPDDQVAAARRAVRDGRAPSVSAYISAALKTQQDRDSLGLLLDDLDREYGPVPAEAAEWAERVADRVATKGAGTGPPAPTRTGT